MGNCLENALDIQSHPVYLNCNLPCKLYYKYDLKCRFKCSKASAAITISPLKKKTTTTKKELNCTEAARGPINIPENRNREKEREKKEKIQLLPSSSRETALGENCVRRCRI